MKISVFSVSFSLISLIILPLGFVFWDNHTKKVKQQLGDDFTAAVELAKDEDIDAALIALDRIVDKGSDGYITMAKMKKASLLIDKGELNQGLEIYLDLEKNAVDHLIIPYGRLMRTEVAISLFLNSEGQVAISPRLNR